MDLHKRLKREINSLEQETDFPFEFKFSDTDSNTLYLTILINSNDYPKLDAKYLKCSVRLSFRDYPWKPPTIDYDRELFGNTFIFKQWCPAADLKTLVFNIYYIYLEYLGSL